MPRRTPGVYPMIDTEVSLRSIVAAYLADRLSFERLDATVARMGEAVTDDDPGLLALWGALELRLAERSSGHLDDEEFRADLLAIVPLPVAIGAWPRVQQVTASSARSIRYRAAGVYLGTRAPAGDTQVAAVLV